MGFCSMLSGLGPGYVPFVSKRISLSFLQNSAVRLLPTFRCLWLDFVTCLFAVFHARAYSGRAQPTPPVTCKTDVLQVAQFEFLAANHIVCQLFC